MNVIRVSEEEADRRPQKGDIWKYKGGYSLIVKDYGCSPPRLRRLSLLTHTISDIGDNFKIVARFVTDTEGVTIKF